MYLLKREEVQASRLHGAVVARKIPDLQVGGSIPSAVTPALFFPFFPVELFLKTFFWETFFCFPYVHNFSSQK